MSNNFQAFSGFGRILGTGSKTVAEVEPPAQEEYRTTSSSGVEIIDPAAVLRALTSTQNMGGPTMSLEFTQDPIHTQEKQVNTGIQGSPRRKEDYEVLVRGAVPLSTPSHPLQGVTPGVLQILPAPALLKMLQQYIQSAPTHAYASIPAETFEAMEAAHLREILIGVLPA